MYSCKFIHDFRLVFSLIQFMPVSVVLKETEIYAINQCIVLAKSYNRILFI